MIKQNWGKCFRWELPEHNLPNWLIKIFPLTYICIHISCSLKTLESLWHHKGVAAPVNYRIINTFATVHCPPLPTSVAGLQTSPLLCIKSNWFMPWFDLIMMYHAFWDQWHSWSTRIHPCAGREASWPLHAWDFTIHVHHVYALKYIVRSVPPRQIYFNMRYVIFVNPHRNKSSSKEIVSGYKVVKTEPPCEESYWWT